MIRAEQAGTPASGVLASLFRLAARGSIRYFPRDVPGRAGSALCAITSASVLAYVRRSVSVGGLAAGARAVVDLVPVADHQPPNASEPEKQRMARWIVNWSKGNRLEATCLPRSLAMWAVLQADGFPAVFCMGASNKSLTEPSHAWVEVNGLPVLERDDPRVLYTRFALAEFYPARLVSADRSAETYVG